MVCVICDQPINDCQCPDIEDRLRLLMQTGNEYARHWAKEALFGRLSQKKIRADEPLSDEMMEVLEWSLNKQWGKQARMN